MAAKISHTPVGDVILKFPYSQSFIEELKYQIPQSYRTYDADTKTWRIDRFYADEAVSLFYEYFPDAEGSYYTERPAVPALPEWCLTLHVLPTAPRQVVDAAYKALCKLYHPDTASGSHEKMKQLNQAVEEAREAAAR